MNYIHDIKNSSINLFQYVLARELKADVEHRYFILQSRGDTAELVIEKDKRK